MAAGHTPETYDRYPIYIYLAYAAPSDEFADGKVKPRTSGRTINARLTYDDGKAQTVKVIRSTNSTTEVWSLNIVDLRPIAQSQRSLQCTDLRH